MHAETRSPAAANADTGIFCDQDHRNSPLPANVAALGGVCGPADAFFQALASGLIGLTCRGSAHEFVGMCFVV